MSQRERISVGVGAVVFRGEDVLLIRRGKPPFEGQWSIPGGGLKPGERLKDAVRREVREETGVEIEIIALLDVFELPQGAAGGRSGAHMVLIDYVAEWTGGALRAGDDAAAAEFVDIKTAVARLSWDKTRQAIRRAAEIRRALGTRP